MQKRTPAQIGYDLAIAKVTELHKAKTGFNHGAIAWLAGKLGVSRQAVLNWSDRRGFPDPYVAKVAKITGLPPEIIRPKYLVLEMTETNYATLPDDPWKNESAVITNQRNRHG